MDGLAIDLWNVPPDGKFVPVVNRMAEEIGTAVYAGYSMGGRIALAIAVERPQLVEALILVSASPGIRAAEERVTRLRADEELAEWITDVGVSKFLDRWLSEPMFADLDHDAARRDRIEDAEVIAGQLRRLGQGSQPSYWERLAELAMPVLLIAGEDDAKYASIANRAAEAIGDNASVEIVPGAGHSLLVERPDVVADAITAFLSRYRR